MNKLRALVGVSLCAFVLVPVIASAAVFKTGEQAALHPEESSAQNVYLAGGTVTQAGTVAADVSMAGGELTLSGPVQGDTLALGGAITIKGDVGEDLRAFGGTIDVTGVVGGDAVVGGGDVTLSGAGIKGDVFVIGGNVTISAPIEGSLSVVGGTVFINAPVQGAVYIKSEDITLGAQAKIESTFTYASSRDAQVKPGAVVSGETVRVPATSAPVQRDLFAFFSFYVFTRFIMTFLGALLLGYLLHGFSRELVAYTAHDPLPMLARGIVTCILLPLSSIILIASVIGIPLGILGLLLFGSLLIFASFAAPVVLGSIAHQSMWKGAEYVVDWRTILLGTVLYFVIRALPLVGSVAAIIVGAMVIGALMVLMWSAVKEWR